MLYARDVYGQTLVELGKKDPNVVVLDADLSGSTRTKIFAKEFPKRFLNFFSQFITGLFLFSLLYFTGFHQKKFL